jgi:hypothetical protein
VRKQRTAGNALELLRTQILQHNLPLRLQLQKFQDEAHELCRAGVGVRAPDGGELDGAIDDCCRVEGETVFLCSTIGSVRALKEEAEQERTPVHCVVDTLPNHGRDEVLLREKR